MGFYKDAMYGLAVGDALGVPVEFMSRDSLRHRPVTKMEGHGTHLQPKGTWSDDTSLALATLYSIGENHLIFTKDIMNHFVEWFDNGTYAIDNKVFDVGMSTRKAIKRYKAGRPVTHCGGTQISDNGNGSLMRIIPVCIALHNNNTPERIAVQIIEQVSRLTHAHEISLVACGIYYFIAREIMRGNASLFEMIENGITNAQAFYGTRFEPFDTIDADYLLDLECDKIKSGGYVKDTLTASLWCLLHTSSYEACVLKAVNLGDDTDTTAAVAGGLAGLYYGFSSIPKNWIKDLKGKDLLDGAIMLMEGK